MFKDKYFEISFLFARELMTSEEHYQIDTWVKKINNTKSNHCKKDHLKEENKV